MAETKKVATAKKPVAKTATKPAATKTVAKPAAKTAAAKPAVKTVAKPAVKAVAKPAVKAVAKPAVKAEVKKVAHTPVQAKTAAKKKAPYESKGTVTIKLVRGINGCVKKQKRTVEALGLKRIGDTRTMKDNPAIRGMIFVVKHLVEVK